MTASKRTIALHFGALVDPLWQQLDSQGVLLVGKEGAIETFQKDADAITRLNVRGFLNNSTKMRLHRALMKKIVATLEVKRRRSD